MNSEHLNEHDANQGAQSTGEFLGMTGNSSWYLFGSSGASLLLVIVLWGVLGLSLLLCLLLGLILCGLSVTYVFALKNNRPPHYDTDFFESALVEAGVMPLAFGPRERRPSNPFRSDPAGVEVLMSAEREDSRAVEAYRRTAPMRGTTSAKAADAAPVRTSVIKSNRRSEEVPSVSLAAFDRLQNELNTTTEMLEEALAEHEEERV